MPEAYYDRDFPQLKGRGFQRKSEPADYNCIAFAVDDLKNWWWPSGNPDEYWPLPIPEKADLQSFIEALATVGFTRCANGDPESGAHKIALYALDDNIKHAARLDAGQQHWKSKLGPHEDIEHTLDGLEGPCYGKVIAYFRKEVGASPTQPPSTDQANPLQPLP